MTAADRIYKSHFDRICVCLVLSVLGCQFSPLESSLTEVMGQVVGQLMAQVYKITGNQVVVMHG